MFKKIFKDDLLCLKLCLAAISLVLLLLVWNNRETSPIYSDGAGYYEFLPAFLQYKDPWLINLQVRGLNTWNNGLGASCYYVEESGRHIILYPIGVALLLSPFYLLAHMFCWLSGEIGDSYSYVFQFFIRIGAITYFIIGSYYLLKSALIYVNTKFLLVIYALLIFSTNLVHYVVYDSCFSHAYSYFLVCMLIYFIKNNKLPDCKSLLKIGTIFGLLLLIRNTNIIFIILIINYLIKDRLDVTSKEILYLLLPIFIICFPQFLYNYYASNKIFFTAYTELGNNFSNLLSPKIFDVLFSVNIGWLFWNPICLIFLLFGLLSLRKVKDNLVFREYISYLLVLIIQVYIVSSWYMPSFGACFGHRAFVEFLPLVFLFGCLSWYYFSKNIYSRIILYIIFPLFTLFNFYLMFSYWGNRIPWDYKTINNIILSLPLDIDDVYLKSVSSIYEENKILLKYSEAKVCGIPSGHKSLNIDVYNQSGSYLMLNIFDINLAYRMFDFDFTLIEEYKPIERTTIGIIKPFGVKKLRINIELPEKGGLYYIKPCIVHENVKWCMDEAYVNPFIPCLVN
jgi:hypothetical protein